jgi:putative oxidoreductase
MFLKRFFSPFPWSATGADWASLMIRFTFGGMMAYNHGYSKWKDLMGGATDFPDPLGIGAYWSFVLTIVVELVCCSLLAVGLFTRFAALALSFTMFVAAFGIHTADPLDVKEHALMYAFAGIAIFFLGAGRFSLDSVLGAKGKKP